MVLCEARHKAQAVGKTETYHNITILKAREEARGGLERRELCEVGSVKTCCAAAVISQRYCGVYS